MVMQLTKFWHGENQVFADMLHLTLILRYFNSNVKCRYFSLHHDRLAYIDYVNTLLVYSVVYNS